MFHMQNNDESVGIKYPVCIVIWANSSYLHAKYYRSTFTGHISFPVLFAMLLMQTYIELS